MKIRKHEYTIPEWAVCYLINGDMDNLSYDDMIKIRALEMEVSMLGKSGHWAMSGDGQESYFAKSNDMDGQLGGMVYDMVYCAYGPLPKSEDTGNPFKGLPLQGNDVDIDTCLSEYGLAWQESRTQFRFWYGVEVYDNPEWRQAEYIRFAWSDFKKDTNVFKEFDWVDWDSVFSFVGMPREEWELLSLPQQLSDLQSYYGYENVFGSAYVSSPIWMLTGTIPEGYLESILPHGSGIDCNWEFRPFKNGKVECRTEFHAMNETGMYDGYMPFRFTVEWDKYGKLVPGPVKCNENARASFHGLKEYLNDLIYQSFE